MISEGSLLFKDFQTPPNSPPFKMKQKCIITYIERLSQVAGYWAQILGRLVSVCTTTLGCMHYFTRLRALLYIGWVRYYTCVHHIRA